MQSVATILEQIVLSVHRRNGGNIARLDFSWPLLDPQLSLDSLDLAEVMVALEREFECAPLDSDPPPKTWADILQMINGNRNLNTCWTHSIRRFANGDAGL